MTEKGGVKGFTDDDVKNYVEFLNMVVTRAKFDNMSIKESMDLSKLYVHMIGLKRVIEDHVFKIEKVIDTKKDKAKETK